MSGKEEVQTIKMGKTEEATKTDAQLQREQNIQRKRAQDELNNYKKRIRDSNELKRLQVEELELNLAFYKNKAEWLETIPLMEALEVKEKEMNDAAREKARKEYEATQKALETTGDDKPDTPKLISVGGGTPRSKK
jgi:hypothetical protein